MITSCSWLSYKWMVTPITGLRYMVQKHVLVEEVNEHDEKDKGKKMGILSPLKKIQSTGKCYRNSSMLLFLHFIYA